MARGPFHRSAGPDPNRPAPRGTPADRFGSETAGVPKDAGRPVVAFAPLDSSAPAASRGAVPARCPRHPGLAAHGSCLAPWSISGQRSRAAPACRRPSGPCRPVTWPAAALGLFGFFRVSRPAVATHGFAAPVLRFTLSGCASPDSCRSLGVVRTTSPRELRFALGVRWPSARPVPAHRRCEATMSVQAPPSSFAAPFSVRGWCVHLPTRARLSPKASRSLAASARRLRRRRRSWPEGPLPPRSLAGLPHPLRSVPAVRAPPPRAVAPKGSTPQGASLRVDLDGLLRIHPSQRSPARDARGLCCPPGSLPHRDGSAVAGFPSPLDLLHRATPSRVSCSALGLQGLAPQCDRLRRLWVSPTPACLAACLRHEPGSVPLMGFLLWTLAATCSSQAMSGSDTRSNCQGAVRSAPRSLRRRRGEGTGRSGRQQGGS